MDASSHSRIAIRERPQEAWIERAEFIATERGEVLTVSYLPRTTPSMGVVVCSALFAEYQKNYRREVILARRLADNGIAAIRFDPRGVGHSDGSSEAFTLADAITDAHAALSHLSAEAAIPRVGFMGTRLAGWIAARAAAGIPDAPLLLWEPVLDIRAYLRELGRMLAMSEAARRGAAPRSPLLERLQTSGSVDVFGYSLSLPVFEEMIDRDLLADAGGRRSLLIVQLRPTADISPGYSDLVAKARSSGHHCDISSVREDVAWWLEDPAWDPLEARSSTQQLVSLSTEWLLARTDDVGVGDAESN